MEKLQEKAILLGASQFGKSKRKNKRFFRYLQWQNN